MLNNILLILLFMVLIPVITLIVFVDILGSAILLLFWAVSCAICRGIRENKMCDFGLEEKEPYVHEDWGNIQAEMDENKTNEEATREYDEKHRVW